MVLGIIIGVIVTLFIIAALVAGYLIGFSAGLVLMEDNDIRKGICRKLDLGK